MRVPSESNATPCPYTEHVHAKYDLALPCRRFFVRPASIAQREGNDDFFQLGPDSLRQEGVPHGEVLGPFTLPSQVYEGTQHTYWVYVPAQYDPERPCSLMIFNDGHAFLADDGSARATNVD